ADPGRRTAQRRLAREVTATVHGDAAAEQAIQTSAALFGGGQPPSGGADAMLVDLTPAFQVSRAEFGDGLPLVDILVRTGLASSKADARRGIEGKGFYVNEAQISDVNYRLEPRDLQRREADDFVMLRKGKKNYLRLV